MPYIKVLIFTTALTSIITLNGCVEASDGQDNIFARSTLATGVGAGIGTAAGGSSSTIGAEPPVGVGTGNVDGELMSVH